MYNSTHEYEACVLVNGKPVTEVKHNWQIYIEGRKNSVYELQFKNKTNRRVLVVPSVDGLNVLDGNPCGAESGGYVVSAYETLVIPGWKVDGDTAAEFVFKPQGTKNRKDKTYVEAMGHNSENQGVIGFMVFQEKIEPLRVPYRYEDPWDNGFRGGPFYYGSSEIIRSYVSNTSAPYGATASSATPTMGSNVESNLGTGFGEATDFKTTTTTFKRKSTAPDALFAFFYDTIQNMKKIGVPTEKFHPKRRNKTTPNPFPESPDIVVSGCKPPKGWR